MQPSKIKMIGFFPFSNILPSSLNIFSLLSLIIARGRICYCEHPVGWYVRCRIEVSDVHEYVPVVLRELGGKCAKSGW
jgi:hypothetical protein